MLAIATATESTRAVHSIVAELTITLTTTATPTKPQLESNCNRSVIDTEPKLQPTVTLCKLNIIPLFKNDLLIVLSTLREQRKYAVSKTL